MSKKVSKEEALKAVKTITKEISESSLEKEALEAVRTLILWAGDDKFLLDGLKKQGEMFGMQTRNCSPDRWLDEGDSVNIGNEILEVFFCPGHTPGHIIFFNKKANLALVGDVLFSGSIGRTDLPGGNFDQLIDSVKNKLWPLGDDIYFIPGHGPASTFKVERETNPFVSDSALS